VQDGDRVVHTGLGERERLLAGVAEFACRALELVRKIVVVRAIVRTSMIPRAITSAIPRSSLERTRRRRGSRAPPAASADEIRCNVCIGTNVGTKHRSHYS